MGMEGDKSAVAGGAGLDTFSPSTANGHERTNGYTNGTSSALHLGHDEQHMTPSNADANGHITVTANPHTDTNSYPTSHTITNPNPPEDSDSDSESEESLTYPLLPPFPSNVPTAPLLRLSLQKLVQEDEEEAERLWRVCEGVGFFYLDLRGPASSTSTNDGNGVVNDRNGFTDDGITDGNGNGTNGTNGNGTKGDGDGATSTNRDGIDGNTTNGTNGTNINRNSQPPTTNSAEEKQKQEEPSGPNLLSLANHLFALAPQIFALTPSEKHRLDLSSQNSYFGFKPLGTGVLDSKGTRDRNEFYNASKDDLLGHLPEALPAPPVLREEGNREVLREFMRESHGIVGVILGVLERKLGLPRGGLRGLHRLGERSGDQVRWVRSPGFEVEEGEGEGGMDEEKMGMSCLPRPFTLFMSPVFCFPFFVTRFLVSGSTSDALAWLALGSSTTLRGLLSPP